MGLNQTDKEASGDAKKSKNTNQLKQQTTIVKGQKNPKVNNPTGENVKAGSFKKTNSFRKLKVKASIIEGFGSISLFFSFAP